MLKPDNTYHGGRGGEGNVVLAGEKAEEKKKDTHDGLADRLKSEFWLPEAVGIID